MEFDLATGIISVIIAATSAVTIYLIAEFSRTGPSYDDLKASHRQERNLHYCNVDSKADTKRQKKLKKKVKTMKTNVTDENFSEDTLTSHSVLTDDNLKDSDHHSEDNLEVEPQIQVSETKTVSKPIKNKNKTAKKSKSKSDSADLGDKQSAPVENHKTEAESELPLKNLPNHQFVPVAKDGTDSSPESISKNELYSGKNEESEVHEPIVEAKSVDLSEESPYANSATNKIKKKIKKKKTEVFDVNGASKSKGIIALNNLLPIIQQAELSHSELQILIDTLLNKENDSEWYQGRQDPMLKLKKQLLEMEKTHSDDMDTISGLQAKLTTLRTDLNSEKSYSKTLRESLSKTGSELMVFSLKCQQVSEENQTLISQINQMQQQIEQHQMVISKFEEEKVLQQQMHIPHEQHHEAVLALQGQVNHLASQLQEQQNLNTSLSVQLQESMRIQEEFRSMNAELEMLLNSSQYEVQNLNSRLQSVSKEMDEARSKIADFTGLIDVLESNKSDLKRKNEQFEVEISQLSQANKLQKNDSVDSSTEGTKNNGNVSFTEADHSSCLSRLEDKENLVKNLNLELNQKESVLEKLTNDVINCKNEANKKQTQIENLNVEISSLKSLNTKVTSDLNAERIIITELRVLLSQKSEEASQLSREVDSIRQKNSELRNKNYKLVEALSQAENSLKEASIKLEESSKVQRDLASFKKQIIEIVESLNPPFNMGDSCDNESWLSEFSREIKKLERKDDSSNTSDLVTENLKLQNMVVRYRSIIADLEVMLHNLEMRIQSEEEKQHKSIRTQHSLFPEVDD